MKNSQIDLDSLTNDLNNLKQKYQEYKAQGLTLDMTRGKPSAEQLNLSNPILTILDKTDYYDSQGVDCRNYGGLSGISDAKTLFAEYLEVQTDEIFIGGNTSLGLMHDIIARSYSHGNSDSTQSWGKLEKVKFLCPAPGYDRHFSICEHFNIEMITIGLLANGDPDMNEVERLVETDATIKGIWFVPKYGNPSGLNISDSAVDRLASMDCAADDFRIIWDNAYNVHHLTEEKTEIKDLLLACKAADNADRVFIVGSTSKISFAGAGVAAIGASSANIKWLEGHASIQTIGSDKINQLRHVRFFKNMHGIHQHMTEHAKILRPKFLAVDQVLTKHLGAKNLAHWSKPKGGYFVNLDVQDNCATKIVEMAKAAGVIFTSAGATFPYGNDPRDRNIRIAPSLPSLDEIATAMEILTLCIQLVSVEVLSANRQIGK